MIAAVIGIGSNSMRMLVADLDLQNKKLKRLSRSREGLRVFSALDQEGNISAQMIQDACVNVCAMKQDALRQGAETIHLFATSAVRDAKNQADFAQAIEACSGLKLVVCSGDFEAALSYWGAASCDTVSGLIDIGGGSTEIAIGCGNRIDLSASLQMGAVRLFRILPISTDEDVRKAVAWAKEILAPELPRFLPLACEKWVGIGGAFTSTAAFVQRVPVFEKNRIHGFVLNRQHVRDAIYALAPMPLQERLTLPYLQPQRADIVVHGLAILLACMESLCIEEMTVSEYGNLEGYLKKQYLL